jgi:hypothetical protein
MNATAWQCARCLALNWAPAVCRACDHPRHAPAPLRVARPRALLALPRQNFPYGRTHRTRPALGSWILPALLFSASIAVATFWDPLTAQRAFAGAGNATRATAWAARHDDLGRAVQALRELHGELAAATLPGAERLAPDWYARLERLTARYALHGGAADPELADDEVALRVVALELFALHRRYTTGSLDDGALTRLAATQRELDRISEDLAHVP